VFEYDSIIVLLV